MLDATQTPPKVELIDGDTLYIQTAGTLSPEDAQKLLDKIKGLAAGERYLFCLADMSKLTELPPQSRKALTELRDLPIRGSAFVGKGAVRTATILSHCMKSDNPSIFFSDEQDAKLWLAQQREKIASESL